MSYGFQMKEKEPPVRRKSRNERKKSTGSGGISMKNTGFVKGRRCIKGNRSKAHSVLYFKAPDWINKSARECRSYSFREEMLTRAEAGDMRTEKKSFEEAVWIIDFMKEYDTLLVGCRYAIATALAKEELEETYQEELAAYKPYIYLTEEMGRAFRDYPCS